MEGFLPHILENRNIKTKNVPLINSTNIIKLETESPHHSDHRPAEGQQRIDPHIWLSTSNAIALLDEIAKHLIQIDHQHAKQYLSNRDMLKQKIKTLALEIRSKMKNNTTPYITYHNATQYFEDEFGLNNIASVKPNEETQPSVRHISNITQMIKHDNIHCLVYNQPEKPRLIRSLQDRTGSHATALDPVGVNIEPGQNAWFEIMQDVASNLSSCLAKQ